MATLEQIEQALRAADAAGNVEDARKLAQAYAEMRGQQSAPRADFSGVSGQSSTVAASRPATYNLTGQRDLSTQIGGFLDAFQHRALDPFHGIGQLAAHGGNAVVQRVAGGSDYAQGVQEAVADNDRWLAQREADYQARTSGNEMSYGGSVAGAVAPWMVGIGQLRAAGALPRITATGAPGVAQKGGLLALEGAAMGTAQPVIGEGSYGEQKAAQVGIGAVAAPAIAGGMWGAGKGLQGIGRLAQYLTEGGREQVALRRLAKLYGVDDAALARLRQDTGIPGFQLTPAQALGTPEAVQAERVLRNNGATAAAFAGRESQNNAALRGAVEGIAGDDAAMAAARQARTAATSPYYESLQGQRVDPAPVLKALDALHNSGLGTSKNVAEAVASLRQGIKSRLGKDGKIDADVLSGYHEQAGSHLGPMASGKEKVALGPIKDSIADALDRAVPGYRDNLAAYGRASQPINDMEAARTLLGAIDSGGRDAGGNQSVNLAKVRQLLSKDDKARFPMSADARATLEAVLEALQKRSITNNTIAASGPGSAADVLRGLQNNPFAMRLLGHLTSAGGGVAFGLPGYAAGAALTEGLTAANSSVLRKVGQKGADAKMTADALEAYRNNQNRSNNPLIKLLLPYEQRLLPSGGGR